MGRPGQNPKIPLPASNTMQKNSRPSILILAKTGFIIRNLILGTLPGALNAGIKVVAAVPNPKDPHLRKIVPAHIDLIEFPMPKVLEVSKLSRWSRVFNGPHVMYRLVQGYKNSASMQISSKVYDTLDARWYVWSVKGLVGLGALFFKLKLMPLVEACFYRSLTRKPYYQAWLKILQEHNPGLVVSTTLTLVDLYTISADLPVTLAAHKLGIPCGTLVQSWDNLFTKPSLIPKHLIRYWLWSQSMKTQFKSFYPKTPDSKLVVVGGVQFDFHTHKSFIQDKNLFFKSLKLDPQRPYVVFTTATRRNLPYEDISVVSVIEEVLKRLPAMQIVIRLHPKDYGARWKPYQKYFTEKGVVLQYSSLEIAMDAGGVTPPEEFYRTQINTLYYACVILNTGSTTMVDASILDKPVIYMLWDDKTDGLFPEGRVVTFAGSSHLQAIIKTGGVSMAKNKTECVSLIQEYLKNPSQLSKNRKQICELVTYKADGLAGFRLAQDIQTLLSHS